MFNVDRNGMINISRGDSFEIPLFINKGTDMVPLRWYINNTGAEVFLAITEPGQSFEDALVRKRYTEENINENGDIVVKISHDDTKCLTPGKYFYQFKLRCPITDKPGQFEVNTIIPRTQFIVEE